jgi:drug/metabolite transporter (DMT)-like permease
VTQSSPPHGTGRMAMIGPALLAASSLACADVLSKVTFRAGGDALSVATLRGIIGLVVLLVWLRAARPPVGIARRERWISLALGGLFAANVFLLFKAIAAIGVAVAILTYFVYPLLTGMAAAAIGLEQLSWRGGLAAVCAFLGLAMMLGATSARLAPAGVVAALAAAGCRVAMLLITRATLQGVNPLAITLYSMVSSTALLAAASLFTGNWQPPLTAVGWLAAVGLSIFVMTGILGVFASTVRIGPFRTALFMNLEPLLAAIAGAAFLGELITPLQALGGAVMILALMAFQLRR